MRNTFVDVPVSSNSRSLRPTVSESAASSSASYSIATNSNGNFAGPHPAPAAAEPVKQVTSAVQGMSLNNIASSSRADARRVYCPVPGCPDGCPERVAGWASHRAMRQHLNDHASGVCVRAIPSSYLSEHRLEQCQVCSEFLSIRFGGTCPR